MSVTKNECNKKTDWMTAVYLQPLLGWVFSTPTKSHYGLNVLGQPNIIWKIYILSTNSLQDGHTLGVTALLW